ncbi:hypothetical protein GGR55DRAFT_456548 [Xylaria sp. FL0064]|nr:hypothetical protein GGR55DRAFT_456548 [Xylaria sp. FL0064]
MSLFWVSDSTVAPRLARAHVAKNAHALARRKRTAKYQAGQPRHEVHSDTARTQHEQCSRTYRAIDDRSASICSGRSLQDDTQGTITTTVPSLLLDKRNLPLGPFELFPHPVSRFECSLVRHYVNVMVPLNGDLTSGRGSNQTLKFTVMREWLPVALSNPPMQMGVYLYACRSLYAKTGNFQYYQRALQYKASCLRLLSEVISASLSSNITPISDATISTVLQLASDELVTGDHIAWSRHINAIKVMVKLKGGLYKIQGMNGLLRKLIEILSSKDIVFSLYQLGSEEDRMASITLETLFK